MNRKRIGVALMAALLMGWCGGPDVWADDKPAAEVLESKGLAKVGFTYLLDGDVNLRDGLKVMRQARKQWDDSTARRRQMEREVSAAHNALEQWGIEYRALNESVPEARTPYDHNRLVSRINVLDSMIREGTRAVQDREADLAKLPDNRDGYITAVLDLSQKMEATAKQYAALAADPDVTGALAQLNQTARAKVKLGPSAQFTQELRSIRRERDKINAGVISFQIESGVPQVTVTLNGQLTQKMVFDSGAAIVSLTSEVAARLGLVPGPDDPVVELTAADGKVTKAHVMHLKSVRLGQFTVNDVECAVNPPDLKGADNLLGGTFLRNFVYRMDLAAKEVHMAQILSKPPVQDAKPKLKPIASRQQR